MWLSLLLGPVNAPRHRGQLLGSCDLVTDRRHEPAGRTRRTRTTDSIDHPPPTKGRQSTSRPAAPARVRTHHPQDRSRATP